LSCATHDRVCLSWFDLAIVVGLKMPEKANHALGRTVSWFTASESTVPEVPEAAGAADAARWLGG